ncbi:nuclease A inhibitor family protein [Rufibacter roseus]|uniref:Nuclease A inhibitor family protein n=1 Tax=Rufibacter roseus TaxID=1567108 RepID=A0ABW2DJU7_9BACT|nr:nuclease A inhibitor family protein [Rufibacter roseus]
MKQILIELEQAAQGLFYRSETDAPFEAVDFGAQEKASFSSAQLLRRLELPATTPVDTQELSFFFRNMTKVWPEMREERRQEALKFQQLERLLLQSLHHLQVYRVGKIRLTAYLLGWDTEGQLVGLKTTLVET